MATDVFAKIGDIKGESQDAKHKDEVEVLSWSWGVSNETSSPGGGGGGGAGRASFADFSFMHRIDRASTSLMSACATGRHIKDATITNRKAGKGQQDYLIIKMNDILITSVQPSLAAGAEGMESVSLKPARIHVEYRPQRPDGSLDAGVHFKFDILSHKEG
jgi:type VI secretion system secreted protein Hcp